MGHLEIEIEIPPKPTYAVLILHDDPITRDDIINSLREAHPEANVIVKIASYTQKALSLFEQFHPTLHFQEIIVNPLMAPATSGLTLRKEVEQLYPDQISTWRALFYCECPPDLSAEYQAAGFAICTDPFTTKFLATCEADRQR